MGKISEKKEIKRHYKKQDELFFDVQKIVFDKNNIIIKVNGTEYIIPLKNVSKKLLSANKIQREAYRIICSGYGINWPLIDEDLTIKGLIERS